MTDFVTLQTCICSIVPTNWQHSTK